ncbi:transcription factor bHLH51 [Beta vulgaris subsp. vulgaris]|uniref:transcription factor bHLH51 n=1 Tax=Beta vulgaris subsp. vulgaris TaxID=3555 RepID=UPI002037451E|nr:transcription factor bHLH51 [Beta vulgaris subsp. vulgaris]
MAKNSFCYPGLPEEETITHHFHATASRMELQELPTNNYAFQYQEDFDGYAEFEDKAAAAASSHSHRQAEKRRRDRINGQLTRLRRLIPKSDKMDKAALLEKVVEQVKDLKRKASEINKFFTIPTESDDITIDCHTETMQEKDSFPSTIIDHDHKENHPFRLVRASLPISGDPGVDSHPRPCGSFAPKENKENHPNNNNNNIVLIKATFCCEDRIDLIPELIRALKDLKLTIIGAEIGCLGGRMKSILLLYYRLDVNDGANHGVCSVSAIKQSIMSVLTRVLSWSSASTSNFRVTSKRQRFFFSS